MNYTDSIGLFIAIICGIILCGVAIYVNLPPNGEQTIIRYNGTAPSEWVPPKGVTGIDYTVVGDGYSGVSLASSNDATKVSEDKILLRIPTDCKNPRVSGIVIRNHKPKSSDIISYVECDNPDITYEEIMGDDGNTQWKKCN